VKPLDPERLSTLLAQLPARDADRIVSKSPLRV